MVGIENKVAVVTGAGQGIGQGIALMLARQGAKVAILDLNDEKIEETGIEVLGMQGDASDGADVSRMIRQVLDRFQSVDILVNNAGISVVSPTTDLSEEDWDRGINVNLKSTFLCSKTVAPLMKARGGGKILNISSIAGIDAFPERAVYCSAKAGLIQLTRVLAVEWADSGITVNSIAPGITKTTLIEHLVQTGAYNEEILKRRIPLKRLAVVEDIAQSAKFLLSKNADYITGITLPVDGGWTAYGYL